MLFVSVGKDGLFDDFKLIPAFEAAVISTLGPFVFELCFVCPLRFWVVVSRGGLGLFRLETFEEKLQLSWVNLFAFDAIEDLDESINLLLEKTVSLREFSYDTIFFVGCFDALKNSRDRVK